MRTKLNPVENTKLTGEQINGDFVSCTGSQLIRILEVIRSFLKDSDWYIADISANNSLSYSFPFSNSDLPLRVGDIDDLIQFTTQVDQFFSGIFLCVPSSIPNPTWSRSFDTEDEPTEDLEDALIEIRAFDTTYFEIYTSNSSWIEILLNSFS
jgi:hypothetical protein